MRKVLGVLVLSTVALVASGASIVLTDNFSEPASPGVLITQVGPGTTAAPGSLLSSGFTRTSSVTVVNGGTASLSINNFPLGTWAYNSNTEVTGGATTTYTNGVSFNATSVLPYMFSLDLVSNTYSNPNGSLTFFVKDADTTWSATIVPLANMGLPITLQAVVPQAVPGLDWSAITAIGFTLDQSGYPDADTAFRNFRFAEVPEPGTYALMGAGLAALAFLRRRK